MKKRLIVPFVALALLTAPPSPASDKADPAPKPEEFPAMVYGSIAGVHGMRHVYIRKLEKVYLGRIRIL
ncbi:MAG: hypothetical protein HY049_03000 [Acidobacteria bacterium]|nr:hypothetical protein [Acidobacteriota bacterium]